MTLEQDVKNSHFSFFSLVGEDKTPDKNCKLVSNQVTKQQPNVANIYLFYLLSNCDVMYRKRPQFGS